ncbi:bifunctional phosphopantothenoylcysteine decarboxylase/phosphopantothenate--cysteine ligase CoaBC [Schaalia georgiae]|uniref:bifunctional phosphopantothenoylcysteine decarboxylase/phosphopantothenate--cysteine ligase CoaBC n=1 Tax=Schaalia georgiae TaxID=52768 RepID=UPI0003FC6211|nr:bifunctional phosphopantothenoylcysteine decarboxylase/phosphopantothenate--cysteine ligase CoaBC [Schaalia georgiae]
MATVVVGVTGGVAAFKAVSVVRELMRAGHDVRVAATAASLNFVGPSTWAGLTGAPAVVDVFGAGAEHVELARVADLVLVVPATADALARIRAGMADDMVALTVLASTAPVVIAPAMHSAMWTNPATASNVAELRRRGYTVIDPEEGALGSGDTGVGRLPEPAAIVSRALAVLAGTGWCGGPLAGARVLVTAGGTHEPIDPVRYLGNSSSGRQGVAIARAAAASGARVTLVAANIDDSLVRGAGAGTEVVPVSTAAQMRDAVTARLEGADALVMAAAVADFRPKRALASKIKKDPDGDGAPVIELVRNPDILAEAARSPHRPRVVVGFAAETGTDEEVAAFGRAKARRKGADLMAVNRVGEGEGFGDVPNRIDVLDAAGRGVGTASGTKDDVAEYLVGLIASRLATLSA